MHERRLVTLLCAQLALSFGCSSESAMRSDADEAAAIASLDPGFADEWLDFYFDEVAHNQWHAPPKVSRGFALLTLALYEGLVGGMPGYRSLSGQLRDLPELPRPEPQARYDFRVVASAAVEEAYAAVWADDYHAQLHMVDVELRVEHLLAQARASGASEEVLERSLNHGRRIGEALVTWCQADGYSTVRHEPFVSPTHPGAWERTGALKRPPMEPHWGRMRTYVLASEGECTATPPVAYAEEESSAFFAEARAAYDGASGATASERDTVAHWADEIRRSYTPVGHWMHIARSAARRYDLTLDRAVELYVRVALALADAAIVCWKAKFDTFLIRPETYIKRFIDPAFRPLVVTPPFPAYTSGHATFSTAAGHAIAALLGEVPVGDESGVPFGRPSRTYESALAAASEAAASRVIGGIHYPMDEHAGIEQGRCVAEAHLDALVTHDR